MATSLFGASTTSAATENVSACLPPCHRRFSLRANSVKASFRLSPRPNLRFSSKGLESGWNGSSVVKVKPQLNKVAVGGSPTSTTSETKLHSEPTVTDLATKESINEFITQVSSLVELVDSKDIMELELKQVDCKILIRKKEALPQPPATYVQSQPQPAALPPVSVPSPAPTATAPTPAPSPAKAQPSKSSHPPLKCPMAGTFYRCPGPGEPPFVKVGDKVMKGQVVCIIEAMKLMNEIEADQSGTVVEVIAADGKPVSIDTPLFVIEP